MKTHPALEHFSAATQAGLQTFQSFADIVLNASEQLCSLNFDAARTFCEQLPLDQPATENDFGKLVSHSLESQSDRVEQATQYFQQFNELFLRTQAELQELNSRHFNEFGIRMQALMEAMGKYAPTTSAAELPSLSPTRSNRKAA